jgi:hypothetical protein
MSGEATVGKSLTLLSLDLGLLLGLGSLRHIDLSRMLAGDEIKSIVSIDKLAATRDLLFSCA